MMTDAQVMAHDQWGTRGPLKSFFDPSETRIKNSTSPFLDEAHVVVPWALVY
jgi:hypothetical protein